jgi:hypothetical protein
VSDHPDHPGFARWKHIDVPIDVSENLQIPQEVPEGWQRPRQCLIDDDDAISFDQCYEILANKWNATAPEIALWISLGPTGADDDGERLHVFDSRHEIYEYDDLLRCRIKRRFPGVEGGTSPCSLFPVDGAPSNGNIAETLGWHSFSRTEVEHFAPSRNRHDSSSKIEYYVNAGSVASSGGWFNPSGRFLSYAEAIDFLSLYAPVEGSAGNAIKQEFSYREFAPGFGCRPLNAFRPPFGIWLNCEEDPQLEGSFYFEGQIIGLAKEKFEADISRWDAATDDRSLDGLKVISDPDIGLDLMHWPECRVELQSRLHALPAEIAMWVHTGDLRVYSGPIGCGSGASQCWKWRKGEHLISKYRRSGATQPEEVFLNFAFRRSEVKSFDPVDHSDRGGPINFLPESFRNPSGRFLTYYQALAYLACCPDGSFDDARAALDMEFRKGQLIAQHFLVYMISPKENARSNTLGGRQLGLEDGLFSEAQVLGLGNGLFRAGVERWDAATMLASRVHRLKIPFFRLGYEENTLNARAEDGNLPDWLTIDQIVSLLPNGSSDDSRDRYRNKLLAAFLANSLSAEIDTYELQEFMSREWEEHGCVPADACKLHGAYFYVHRADLRAFLEKLEKQEKYREWPVPDDWPLAGWWPEVINFPAQDDGKATDEARPAATDPRDTATTDRESPDKSLGTTKTLCASLNVFREMQSLLPTEVTVRFTSGGLVEISVRRKSSTDGSEVVSRRVSWKDLDLQDGRTGELNRQGKALLDMHRGIIPRKQEKGGNKTVSRLRTMLKRQLGLKSDPFTTDWQPHFKVEDISKSRDDRARREASHTSFDDSFHGGQEYPFDPPDENDPAAPYLTDA